VGHVCGGTFEAEAVEGVGGQLFVVGEDKLAEENIIVSKLAKKNLLSQNKCLFGCQFI
jgi:hypothetical protein